MFQEMSHLPAIVSSLAILFALTLTGVASAEPNPSLAPGTPSVHWHILDNELVERVEPEVYRFRRERHSVGQSMVWVELPVSALRGSVLRFAVEIRTELMAGGASFAMNQIDRDESVAFVTLNGREPVGTTPWTTHMLEVPLSDNADTLRAFFWMHGDGEGEAWFRNPRLTLDGVPLGASTAVEEPARESGISALASADRAADIAFAMRIWGFAKYHHPAFTQAARDADRDLFALMRSVLERTSADRARVVLRWLKKLPTDGQPPQVRQANQPNPVRVSLSWIDRTGPGAATLRKELARWVDAQTQLGTQKHVRLAEDSGEPLFDEELTYNVPGGDVGYRLLAAARIWNAINYWFAYREILGEEWNDVLEHTVRDLLDAGSTRDAATVLERMLATVQDSHVMLDHPVLAPERACFLPVSVRIIDGQPIVLRSATSLLRPGDRIEAIGGQSTRSLLEAISLRTAVSTPPARWPMIAQAIVRGPCAKDVDVNVEREGVTRRILISYGKKKVPAEPDMPGWKRFDSVFYLNAAEMAVSGVAEFVAAATGTKDTRRATGLIIDLRGYPRDMLVASLGQHLVATRSNIAQFGQAHMGRPGDFPYVAMTTLDPAIPFLDLPVAILIDETTISRAEYHAMAWRHAPRSVLIGTRTAGTNGDVSTLPLPDGGMVRFTGVRLNDASGDRFQGVGLTPDIVVKVVRADIANGRDAQLERALEWIREQ